jgi:hypothetical protein
MTCKNILILFCFLLQPAIAQQGQISQREYFERILIEREKKFDERFQFQKDEVKSALASMDKRLDGMNEFRASLQDQTKNQVSKSEFQTFKDATDKDIRMLRESKAELDGMASQSSVNLSLGISVLGLLVGSISIVMKFRAKAN